MSSCVEKTRPRPSEEGRLFGKQQQPEKKLHKERFEFVGEPKQLKAKDEDKDQGMDMDDGFGLTSGVIGFNRGVCYYGAFYLDNTEELQQQPQKKRQRERFESEGELKQPKAEDEGKVHEMDMGEVVDGDFNAGESEGESKQLKSKDEGKDHDMDMGEVVDGDFYAGDSDPEDLDLTVGFCSVDNGIWDNEDINTDSFADDIVTRNCLKEPVCNMYLHNSMSRGDNFFELFKVQLIRNPKFSSSSSREGPFCGAIELIGSLNNDDDPISYYSVSEKEPVTIKFDSHDKVLLPISNPNPIFPLASELMMALRFYFKFDGKDLFERGDPHENRELFDGSDGNCTPKCELLVVNAQRMGGGYRAPECYPPCIAREMIGEPDSDPFLVVAYYSVYFGVRAYVSVKILKQGVISCSGFIHARPCVYALRIRLLSTQGDQKLQLDESGSVKLTKSVVAVPSFSSLIITAQLYDQDDKEIYHLRTFFPALDAGRRSKLIKDKDGVRNLEVTVDWNCVPLKWF